MEQRARIAPGPVEVEFYFHEVEFYFHGGPANGQQYFVPLEEGRALDQVGVVTPVETIVGVSLLRSVYAFAPDGCYHWVGDIVG